MGNKYFMERNDWSERYDTKNTKWDLGCSPAPLMTFIYSLHKPCNILIPGCGCGYEILDFHTAGHKVTAIDFAFGAITAARRVVGPLADSIVCDDFFTHPLPLESYDICFERTFLCALPSSLRALYGRRIAYLLKDSGLLVGVFHYGTPERDEVPYPMTERDRGILLESYFSLLHDSPCPSGLKVFSKHNERWQIWKKKPIP